ncbi:MAG: TetR/AcrR family transcriptional regulator [Hyphomicrobiaceae bacterium]|nr:TetR/AcrR family transcriptional regulator [Hyphomicrobiaceae bacterium]
MGRRSVHTPEELREHILQAATELITSGGLAELSAREVARRIGYSAGTIYNVFDNLDDLILTIEGRMLDDLDRRLDQLPKSTNSRQNLLNLAEAYLSFTHANPKLWNLLFEHHLPPGADVPASYRAKLDGLLARIEAALTPLLQSRDPVELKRAARVLWAGVHGITSLSTADKLSNVSTESAWPLVKDLVETYLDGLAAQVSR